MPISTQATGSLISTPTGGYREGGYLWQLRKAKIAEQQTKLKELEQRKVEAENSEIVDIVRGMSIPLAELPLVLQQLRAGKTLGQNVPKSEEVAAE